MSGCLPPCSSFIQLNFNWASQHDAIPIVPIIAVVLAVTIFCIIWRNAWSRTNRNPDIDKAHINTTAVSHIDACNGMHVNISGDQHNYSMGGSAMGTPGEGYSMGLNFWMGSHDER